MASLRAIHNQLSNLEHIIVCVDPVDLDNIWLSLWALVGAPNAHVHIILSPRVLDLQVPTFAELFPKLVVKVGGHYMLDVLSEDAEGIYASLEDGDLPDEEHLRAYFARDTTFQDDPHTRTHIPLYMALSALRFALKFDTKGHDSSRFTFYWDPSSMETIVPGIHHPTHVNDYLYACSDEDHCESSAYLHLRGPEREEKMVAIMRRTANRLAGQLRYWEPEDILHPIKELIDLLKGPAGATHPLVLGGGPFTEMVRLLEDTKLVPLAIVAMARTWWADANLFPNNYNDLMDLDAAMEIEKLVRARGIPTWFFPTECAKAKAKRGAVLRACHWDFSKEELVSIFQRAGDMQSYEQAAAFALETKTLAKMFMFDVLAVVPLAHPDALPSRRAESYWDEVDGQRVIRIRETDDGPIQVFYPDQEAMAASKAAAMEEISHVLTPVCEK